MEVIVDPEITCGSRSRMEVILDPETTGIREGRPFGARQMASYLRAAARVTQAAPWRQCSDAHVHPGSSHTQVLERPASWRI
jgi:hypothetical protein